MARKIQVRRDTSANWISANPVLASGEFGLETDTDKAKLGDGTTVWTSLGYGVSSTSIRTDDSNEFSEVAEKTVPVSGDRFLIEDSADSYNKKYMQATNLPAGVDTTAIHKATAGEIISITLKGSPVGADQILIEDSEDSNNKKAIQISSLPTGSDTDAIHDNVAGEINAIASEMTSPASTDVIIIEDASDSFNKKKLAVSNFPGGVDVSAIHKTTPNEIANMDEVPPDGADQLVTEDWSDGWNKKRLSLSLLAPYVVGTIGLFSVTKNGDQSTTNNAYQDVIGWDTPTINTAGITADLVNGTFTFDNTGTYEISYCLTDDQTIGSSRNLAHHQLLLDTAQIKGTHQIVYSRLSSQGATSCSASVIIPVTASQVLKLQFKTENTGVTQTILADSCVINIKRWA